MSAAKPSPSTHRLLRRRAVTAYDYLYESISNNNICVYCGDDAEVWDHFVPISRAYEVNAGFFLLQSCSGCNAAASDVLVNTYFEKKLYIQSVIRRTFKSTLAMPNWSNEELEEMGWSLRIQIEAKMRQKNWLLNRLAWNSERNIAHAELAEIVTRSESIGRSSARTNAAMITTVRSEQLQLKRGELKEMLVKTGHAVTKSNREFAQNLVCDFGADKAHELLKQLPRSRSY